MPRAGDPIPLSLKLFDGNASKYVKVVLKNADGIPLSESPVTLAHIGEGRYEDSTVLMPGDTAYVSASYQVFDDALMTQLSALYADGTDVFELQIPDFIILSTLNEIRDMLLTSGAGGSSAITAAIEKLDDLIGYVEEARSVTVSIEDQAITADVSDDDPILGNISEDENIDGEI